MSHEFEKELVAKEAIKRVQNHMIIGLGTGSTAKPFILLLLERVQKEKLDIKCVATSSASQKLVTGKIPLIDDSLDLPIDITFDGADRIDLSTFYMIKGGGGALLKEKLVALRSKVNVTLVDSSKIVSPLGGYKIPIEIVQFGYRATIERINKLGFLGSLRLNGTKQPFMTDNGNYIYDLHETTVIQDPPSLHRKLKELLGVIETGLFLRTSQFALVGHPNGKVDLIEKSSKNTFHL